MPIPQEKEGAVENIEDMEVGVRDVKQEVAENEWEKEQDGDEAQEFCYRKKEEKVMKYQVKDGCYDEEKDM